MKEKMTDQEKIFTEHTSDRGLVLNMDKEFLKLNSKKTYMPLWKVGKRSKQTPQQRTTDGKQAWIDAQHLESWGNRKVRQQRGNYSAVKWLKSETLTLKHRQMLTRMQSNRNSGLLPRGGENGTAALEDIWQFLTKQSIVLPYVPAAVLLCVCPCDVKIYAHTKFCTQMFIAASFIIIKNQKLLRRPFIGKKINNCRSSTQWNII